MLTELETHAQEKEEESKKVEEAKHATPRLLEVIPTLLTNVTDHFAYATLLNSH